jgi:hypothetical protein
MPTPLYNECIALIANAYAQLFRLRDWCALEFYLQVTQPGIRWNDAIKDWAAID